jgi:hypothetical protein
MMLRYVSLAWILAETSYSSPSLFPIPDLG